MKNKLTNAQYFTPMSVVDLCIGLRANQGTVLEPSCGNGAFSDLLQDVTAIEIDASIAPHYAQVVDFFQYGLVNKFDTIIGNPPYLSYKAIPKSTREINNFKTLEARLGGLANLYAYFILKSFFHLKHHGEMIFVVPDSVFLTTSNFKLFNFLHHEGSFSDIIRFTKTPFDEVTQDVLIFRYQKDLLKRDTKVRVI